MASRNLPVHHLGCNGPGGLDLDNIGQDLTLKHPTNPILGGRNPPAPVNSQRNVYKPVDGLLAEAKLRGGTGSQLLVKAPRGIVCVKARRPGFHPPEWTGTGWGLVLVATTRPYVRGPAATQKCPLKGVPPISTIRRISTIR